MAEGSNTKPKQQTTMANQRTIKATLVRGRVYSLLLNGKERRFEGGRTVEITEEEMAILKKRAVDTVTINAGSEDAHNEPRQKFRFDIVKAKAKAAETEEDADEDAEDEGDEDTDEDGDEEEDEEEEKAPAKPATKKAATKQARRRDR